MVNFVIKKTLPKKKFQIFIKFFFFTPKRAKLVLSWEKGHFFKFQLEKRLKNLIQDYVICMYLRKAVFECGFLSLFKLLLFLLKLCVFVTSHNTLFSNIRQAFRGETQERGGEL